MSGEILITSEARIFFIFFILISLYSFISQNKVLSQYITSGKILITSEVRMYKEYEYVH